MFDFAQDASGRIGLNPGSIAIPMISTAAVSIRHGWKVQPKLKDYTWKEKPAVWLGITGPSGVNKSAALDVGLEPLQAEEDRWAKANAELMEEHILQKEEHKIIMKAWRDALKDGGRDNAGPMPRAPKIPKRKRSIVENSTMEQLIQIAAENPDGLLQYKDELVGWIASFDAYSGGGKGGASQDRAAALSGYNSSPASKDRVGAQGSGGTHVRAECFSLNLVGGKALKGDHVAIRRAMESLELLAWRQRRPGFLVRLAMWRLRRIVPRNPALRSASVTAQDYRFLHQLTY
ncbi:DUF3987 domain-containing protein [Citreimonas salinaria]|nr:DUF3987 domain-containing protein [Citreimonas salinaria]